MTTLASAVGSVLRRMLLAVIGIALAVGLVVLKAVPYGGGADALNILAFTVFFFVGWMLLPMLRRSRSFAIVFAVAWTVGAVYLGNVGIGDARGWLLNPLTWATALLVALLALRPGALLASRSVASSVGRTTSLQEVPRSVRLLLAGVAGVLVAFAALWMLSALGRTLFATPTFLDLLSAEAKARFMQALPVGALLFILVTWLSSTAGSVLAAGSIAGEHQEKFAVGMCTVVLVNAAFYLLSMPFPAWFAALSVFTIPLAALLAFRLIPSRGKRVVTGRVTRPSGGKVL